MSSRPRNGFLARADIDLRRERPVHRTFVGDFQKPLARLSIKLALESDDAVDVIEHAFLGFAFGAVGGVDATVAEAHPCPQERKLFAVGVKA